MDDDPLTYKGISKTSLSDNARGVALTIERADGASIDLHIYKDDLQDLIRSLTKLAGEAAKIRTSGQGVPISAVPTYADIPITQVAIGMSEDMAVLFLILRLFDFDLTYLLGTDDLRSIAKSFVQVIAALDARSDQPH